MAFLNNWRLVYCVPFGWNYVSEGYLDVDTIFVVLLNKLRKYDTFVINGKYLAT